MFRISGVVVIIDSCSSFVEEKGATGLLTEYSKENDTKESQNDTKKTKIMQEILARLRDNSAITTDEMMKSMDLGRSTILQYLKQLQMDGIIERVRARKFGTWKIVRDL